MAEKLKVKDELEKHLLHDVQGLEEGDKDVDDLDSGAYGVVFKVTVAGLPCMAKKLHKILVHESVPNREFVKKKFYDECVILSKLCHPNIVHFVGVYYAEVKAKRDLMLVMERLKTNLATFVEVQKNVSISIKVSILLDVSYGLFYLHSQNPSIVHRDLTAPNILLTEDCRAKIADLGVSKVLKDPRIVNKQTVAPGNASYMAPETKTKYPKYGASIDVFSFGHLVIHAVIQDWPKTYRPDNFQIVEPGKMEIAERVDALEEVRTLNVSLYQLAIDCLQDEPTARPSTVDLTKTLNKLSVQHYKSLDGTVSICDMSRNELMLYIGSMEHQVQEAETYSRKIEAQLQGAKEDTAIAYQALSHTKQGLEADNRSVKEGYSELVTKKKSLEKQLAQFTELVDNLSTEKKALLQDRGVLETEYIDQLSIATAEVTQLEVRNKELVQELERVKREMEKTKSEHAKVCKEQTKSSQREIKKVSKASKKLGYQKMSKTEAHEGLLRVQQDDDNDKTVTPLSVDNYHQQPTPRSVPDSPNHSMNPDLKTAQYLSLENDGSSPKTRQSETVPNKRYHPRLRLSTSNSNMSEQAASPTYTVEARH